MFFQHNGVISLNSQLLQGYCSWNTTITRVFYCGSSIAVEGGRLIWLVGMSSIEQVDAIVVGAGVVGLAIAARISQHFSNVLVVDKNASFGEETSSRNSEVIHAGIYYPENSLKAALCVSGKEMLYQYCEKRHVPFLRTGKLIVAQNPDEEAYLQQTNKKAFANGVDDLQWVSQQQLRRSNPELSATAALLSPSTGIVDAHSYMLSLLTDIEKNGGEFVAKTAVVEACAVGDGFHVTLNSQGEEMELASTYLINSAGLYAEQVAKGIEGLDAIHVPKIHWCRGHYFSYSGKSPFTQLIYPVPEVNGVGLGIHATLDLGGQLKFGPDTEYIDQLEYGVNSQLKEKFTRAIQRYFPQLNPDKLQPAYSGIRPKLQGPNDSFRDFSIQGAEVHGINGLVNLFGIESPGLTASLAIAEDVLDRLVVGDASNNLFP